MSYFELAGQETSEGKSPRARQVWRITDVETATIARGVAWAAAPIVFDGLLKQDVQVRELGGDQWDAEVTYGEFGSRELDNIPWSFDIGTASLHITQARAHVASYAPPTKTAPDHKGAIGVQGSGDDQTVDGCDIVMPVFTWEETHNVPAALVASYAWLTSMEGMVAHINTNPFRVWAASELLLLGISGQHSQLLERAVPVTYKFASSKTKTGMTMGDITGIDKIGHHYLWIEYEKKKDAASNTLTKRPRAVHVERVYDYADFANLGIGDPWS